MRAKRGTGDWEAQDNNQCPMPNAQCPMPNKQFQSPGVTSVNGGVHED
ncbi:hypothetical protein [Nostoc commune]|nr:hypothetical protein [Nostoc commune]